MAIGIILGNLVPSTGPALQKGQFVGVSLPIGMSICLKPHPLIQSLDADIGTSHRTSGHDVPYSLQSPLRDSPPPPKGTITMGADRLLLRPQLDLRTTADVRPRMGVPP